MATKQPVQTHDRTPENTPLPGGGAWKWDDAACNWIPDWQDTAPAEPNTTDKE
jgi:hypothetical protein